MSTSSKQSSSTTRRNKVFVQVPSSPLCLDQYRALNTPSHVAASSKLKENTPLEALSLSMAAETSFNASLKRKLSHRDPPSTLTEEPPSATKKHKSTVTNGQPLADTQVNSNSGPTDNSQFPNGWAYCHQCNKKRDAAETIRCTVVETVPSGKHKKPTQRRCTNKYCKSCLKNRYDHVIESFQGQPLSKAFAPEFKCPKCNDTCNCPRCRKAKGLEPTGNLGKPKTSAPKAEKRPKVKALPKEQIVQKKKQKELPILNWHEIPYKLSREEVEERIFIREFILRFAGVMEPPLAKIHLDELEVIGGKLRKSADEDDHVGWISEPCLKGVLISLLGLLLSDHEAEITKMIRNAIRDLRAGGLNLTKMWSALVTLRSAVASSTAGTSEPENEPADAFVPLDFPDPLPPVVATLRSTRSLNTSTTGSAVLQTSQMVPVVVSLIHSALETAIIREDLDQGVKDQRDWIRNAREAQKLENERWETIKKTIEAAKDKAAKEENKFKRTNHKEHILMIENALKLVTPQSQTRFTPLGVDDGGRVYYALSPGNSEREAAFEFLEAAVNQKPTKLKKKTRVLSSADRAELKEWSWFIAVWGKPGDTIGSKTDRDIDEKDLDAETWWAFWESDEITKLAEWISVQAGLDEDDVNCNVLSATHSTHPKQGLVDGLKAFAFLLEWRACSDKYGATASEGSLSTSKSAEPVPVERFYGH